MKMFHAFSSTENKLKRSSFPFFWWKKYFMAPPPGPSPSISLPRDRWRGVIQFFLPVCLPPELNWWRLRPICQSHSLFLLLPRKRFSDLQAADSDLLEGLVAEARRVRPAAPGGGKQSAICQHDDSGIIAALQHRCSRMNQCKTATIAGINSGWSSCSTGLREKSTDKHPQVSWRGQSAAPSEVWEKSKANTDLHFLLYGKKSCFLLWLIDRLCFLHVFISSDIQHCAALRWFVCFN